jgi:osmotically-inducible protein OsmY
MAALSADPGLKDSDINVKTDGGVITLAGTVKSQDQIQIAQNVAKREAGDARVESQITVK